MLKITRDTKTRGQKITFTLPADHPAGAISVVGNFNDWTPGANPLVKRGKSQSTSVVVPADYISVFRYLGENGQWFDEPEASYVDEGASVVVPQAKPAPRTRKPTANKKSLAPAPTPRTRTIGVKCRAWKHPRPTSRITS